MYLTKKKNHKKILQKKKKFIDPHFAYILNIFLFSHVSFYFIFSLHFSLSWWCCFNLFHSVLVKELTYMWGTESYQHSHNFYFLPMSLKKKNFNLKWFFFHLSTWCGVFTACKWNWKKVIPVFISSNEMHEVNNSFRDNFLNSSYYKRTSVVMIGLVRKLSQFRNGKLCRSLDCIEDILMKILSRCFLQLFVIMYSVLKQLTKA